MKVATPNQQGQIVIPAKIRKNLGINENTHIKIYVKDNYIIMKPINITSSDDSTIINFKKEKELKDFHYKSKIPREKNLSQKIDSNLY